MLSRTVNYHTSNPLQTLRLARGLARFLAGGSVIGLQGNLGSGKTTFFRGILKAYGVASTPSPTFVLSRDIPVRQGKLRRLIHLDLYRLAPGADLRELGVDEYLERPDTLAFIEWSDRLARAPKNLRVIRFSVQGRTRRLIRIPADLLTTTASGVPATRGPARSAGRPRRGLHPRQPSSRRSG